MSEVILGGDSYNAFEHALRQHVQDARALLERSCPDAGNTYITYTADDGGMWRLQTYTPEVTTKGAELQLVMHAHVLAISQQQGIKTLRGMLTHSPSADND